MTLNEAALLSIGVALATLQVRAWVYRFGLRRRFRRARRGQEEAEAVLARLGYRIVDRQAQAAVAMTVDGEPVEAWVQTDLVVERRGRHAVVEVKTGGKAPDPGYIPTRRQLLEYAVVYPGYDLLLLDMETQRLFDIVFPDLHPQRRPWPVLALATAFAVGLLTMPLYTWWQAHR